MDAFEVIVTEWTMINIMEGHFTELRRMRKTDSESSYFKNMEKGLWYPLKRFFTSVLSVTIMISLSGCNSNLIKPSGQTKVSQNITTTNQTLNNESSNSKITVANNDISENSPPQDKQMFYGDWIIKSAVGSAPASELSNNDVNQLLGKKIYFGSDSASFEGDDLADVGISGQPVIQNPYYSLQNISADDFFTGAYVSFQQLGITGNSTVQVDVYGSKDSNDTWDNDASQFWIKNKNTLIMYIGGVYFELVRSN